jgi:hypothetical protein
LFLGQVGPNFGAEQLSKPAHLAYPANATLPGIPRMGPGGAVPPDISDATVCCPVPQVRARSVDANLGSGTFVPTLPDSHFSAARR